MKKLKILACIVVIGIVTTTFLNGDRFVPVVGAYFTGPPPSVTGAPGENTCTECHAPNFGSGSFTILAPATYEPGGEYEITVRHTNPDPSRIRWGFELTALAGVQAAGTFQNLNPTTQTLTGMGRFYIEHTEGGTFLNQTGGAEWSFLWRAPNSNVGTVTFYAAGNQANGDGTNEGDEIYRTSVTSGAVTVTPTPTPSPSPSPTPTPPASPTPTPSPTPATASIEGRVFTGDGRALRGAIVVLTDPQGNAESTSTSSLGFYSFAGIPTNATYIISVFSKRYRYQQKSVFVNTDVSDLDFFGLE